MIGLTEYDDVTRIKMSRLLAGYPLYFTACYFVDGLLIDTGCVTCRDEFSKAIKDFSLRLIVNTHSHEDHIGNNSILQEKYNVPVFCHPAAIPILADPKKLSLTFYQRLTWGFPDSSHGEGIEEHIETEHFSFEIIHTLGHSDDHICLYEPTMQWLFCGDAYVGGRDRVLREGFDILRIMDSLRKLNEVRIKRIFSGSGSVYEEGSVRLKEKIDYLEDMRKRIHELFEEGKSVGEITRMLFGSESWIYYFTGGKFSSRRLVTSMLQDSPRPSSLKPL